MLQPLDHPFCAPITLAVRQCSTSLICPQNVSLWLQGLFTLWSRRYLTMTKCTGVVSLFKFQTCIRSVFDHFIELPVIQFLRVCYYLID